MEAIKKTICSKFYNTKEKLNNIKLTNKCSQSNIKY